MIAVLPSDCPDDLLEAIGKDAEGRGWKIEASRGREQTILAVSGPGASSELEGLLAPRVDADVIELRSRREYERIARRSSLMHGLMGGLAALVLFALAIPALGFLRAPAEARGRRDLVRVARAEDLPVGTAKLVRIGGERIFVIRLAPGRIFALSAICTYVDGCQLEWSPERLQLVCPCDEGVFDVYGGVVRGPPFAPLRAYEVELVGDDIYVRQR